MATTVRRTPKRGERVGVKEVSRREGQELLDRQARKYLGMSGEEFARQYRAGSIERPDRADVLRVAMLLPFAER